MESKKFIELSIRISSTQSGSSIADEMTEGAKKIREIIAEGYSIDNSHTTLIKAQDNYLCLRFVKS